MKDYWTKPYKIQAEQFTDQTAMNIFSILEGDKQKPQISYSKNKEGESVVSMTFNFMSMDRRIVAEYGDWIVRVEEDGMVGYISVTDSDFKEMYTSDLDV